jgi:biopolymer transport protein ExbD
MKALTFIKHPPPSQLEEQIDLDVTPIMSMFIVLIPFLVSMAVLTHLSVLQFSLPPNVGAGLASTPGEKPKLKLTVIVTGAYLGITLGERMLDSIPAVAGSYDFALFAKRLAVYRAEEQATSDIVVASRDEVHLKQVVAVMDRCREAGFDHIGLSSATADPQSGR